MAPSPVPADGQKRYDLGGAAGLGRMPSMDDKCTPLKHKYDQCFNLWFEEYLGLDSKSSSATSASSSSASTSTARSSADSNQSRFSFFGSDRSGQETGSTDASVDARRRDLRVRYDSCAQLFEDYKACVRQAVRERDLEPLIKEARQFNPFPFPSSTAGGASEQERTKYGNNPFPFSQDPKASGDI